MGVGVVTGVGAGDGVGVYLFFERTAVLGLIGTLRSDDGDGNGNAIKAIGLITKTTILHVHHAFLYISLPSLHNYDETTTTNTTTNTQATTKFPLSL